MNDQQPSIKFRTPSLYAELVGFVIHQKLVVFLSGLSLVASYGFAITSFSLSLDEELHFTISQLSAWLDQDRFGIYSIKILIGDILPLPFFNLFTSCIFILTSSVIWCFTFAKASEGALTQSISVLAFSIFFCTLPCNSYYLTFGTYNIEVSIGSLFSAISIMSLYFYIFHKSSISIIALSLFSFIFSILIYQSFLFVLLSGAIITTAILCAGTANYRQILRFLLFAAALTVTALVVSTILSRLLRSSETQYTNIFFNWGKLSNDFIVKWIWEAFVKTVAGKAFVGGISVPTALIAGLIGVIGLAYRRRGYWLLPLLSLALIVTPFLLSISLGTAMPLRSQQTLPLAFGSFFLLAGLAFPQKKSAEYILGTICILIFLIHGQANTRLFLSKYLAYQRDVATSNEIVSRLPQIGWRGEPVNLVIHGTLPAISERFVVSSETFGLSLLSYDDGRRAPAFMQVLGYSFMLFPNQPAYEVADEALKTMATWPAADSVRFSHGVVIVNFGSN